MEAIGPDDFLCNLYDLDADGMIAALESISTRRTRSPKEVIPIAESTGCTNFIERVKNHRV